MVQDERWRKYEVPAKIYTYAMNNEMSIYISVAAGLAPPDGGTWGPLETPPQTLLYPSQGGHRELPGLPLTTPFG